MVASRDRVEVADGVVTKHHGGVDGPARAARSAVAMRAARDGGLPVPAVIAQDGAVLRTEAVTGARPGMTVLADEPGVVLAGIGRVARRLHDRPAPVGVPGAEHGGEPHLGGLVWVHGDLCPVNVLVADGDVVAVVDWEDTRLDEPLVDLVWTEWLVRTHHPDAVATLPALYAGYGRSAPAAPTRRAVMRRLLAARSRVEGPSRAPLWRRHRDQLAALDLTSDVR